RCASSGRPRSRSGPTARSTRPSRGTRVRATAPSRTGGAGTSGTSLLSGRRSTPQRRSCSSGSRRSGRRPLIECPAERRARYGGVGGGSAVGVGGAGVWVADGGVEVALDVGEGDGAGGATPRRFA